MSEYITRAELEDAIKDAAVALALALPDLVLAINEEAPIIALHKIHEIGESTETTDTLVRIMLSAMYRTVYKSWEGDTDHFDTHPEELIFKT